MKYDWDTWDEKVDSSIMCMEEQLVKEFGVDRDDIYGLLNRKDIYNQIRSAMSGFISYEEDEGEEV